MLRDALSRHGHGKHRAVQQMLRFECFQNDRRKAALLAAALACSERALPQSSNGQCRWARAGISARSRNQSRAPFECNQISLNVSDLIEAV